MSHRAAQSGRHEFQKREFERRVMQASSDPKHYSRSENVLRLAARRLPEQALEPLEHQPVRRRDELSRVQSLFILDEVWHLSTQACAMNLWAELVLNPGDQISTWLAVLCPADQQDQNGGGAVSHHR